MKNGGLLLSGVVLVVAGAAALAAASGLWQTPSLPPVASTNPSRVANSGATPTPIPPSDAGGQLREFQLTVSRVNLELAPGKSVDAFAFNRQVPGPELRVTEGDTVRVTVTNQIQEPTTIHWHGVDVPTDMDGVPDVSQVPIAPSATFTYQFVATPAGTRWYHSHFDEIAQQGGGLYGALIIEPRQATQPRPDREYTLLASQWMAGATPLSTSPAAPTPSATGGMNGMGGTGGTMSSSSSAVPDFSTFTLNGKAGSAIPPLTVRQGERVHLRLINGGATDSLAFGLAGHKLTVLSTDGNLLAQPVQADAVPLGVGERADVEFVADNPGRWYFLGLAAKQGRGFESQLVYAGHENDLLQDFPTNANIDFATYAAFTGPPHPQRPDHTYRLELSGGEMMGMGSESVWTINGKSYPKTDPIVVHIGERVRISLLNMSMEDHPMHLHGHSFQLVGINGKSVDGPFKDTITLRHMEQYDIEFVANNPGTWLFHCHNLVHMTGGLMLQIQYQ